MDKREKHLRTVDEETIDRFRGRCGPAAECASDNGDRLQNGTLLRLSGRDETFITVNPNRTKDGTFTGYTIADEDGVLHDLRIVTADGTMIEFVKEQDAPPVRTTDTMRYVSDFEVLGTNLDRLEEVCSLG